MNLGPGNCVGWPDFTFPKGSGRTVQQQAMPFATGSLGPGAIPGQAPFAQPQPPSPYAQPTYTHAPVYGQTPLGQPPMAQQPYAQPTYAPAPTYAQPAPFQPGAFGQLPGGAQQPMGQMPGASQGAPVTPVACPAYVPPGGQPQGNAAQQAQQAYARQLVSIARGLEQLIPGYQILISVLQDLTTSPRGETLSGTAPLMATLRGAAYHHFATLGAVRRFLCGEATNEMLGSMAVGLNQLIHLHNQARPQVERLVMSATPDLRAALSSLAQTVTAADSLLSQASTAVQAAVGPRLWEEARARAFEAYDGDIGSPTEAIPAQPDMPAE